MYIRLIITCNEILKMSSKNEWNVMSDIYQYRTVPYGSIKIPNEIFVH